MKDTTQPRRRRTIAAVASAALLVAGGLGVGIATAISASAAPNTSTCLTGTMVFSDSVQLAAGCTEPSGGNAQQGVDVTFASLIVFGLPQLNVTYHCEVFFPEGILATQNPGEPLPELTYRGYECTPA
ncbi:hypothetical protein [Promicromonospora iranensis]|uniref:Ig-like domain-containing protein n=1 Tax=Promicromonospora iranensis TaxID=1105144 RepID=A0ABU2CIP4_9MICO|nr:hypothetical protein [Promicromonospora iranensis]MDR7381205.1 hypothetical protein [Promicromonospora iranensis]